MHADGRLNATEYRLLHFVAESGADRDGGLLTSNGSLVDALELSDRTVRRALAKLRALGLIAFDSHQGEAMFAVSTTASLAALEHDLGPNLGQHLGSLVTEVVTEVTSVTPRGSARRKPASRKAKRGVSTSDTSRARAETETERELLPLRQQQFSVESRFDGSGDADPLGGSSPSPLGRYDGDPFAGKNWDAEARAGRYQFGDPRYDIDDPLTWGEPPPIPGAVDDFSELEDRGW
jgi:hypothetical protein